MVQTGLPMPASAAQARRQADTPSAPSPSPPPPGPFVVRIVDLDYQMVRPVPGVDVCYSSLAGEAVDRVPVVRVFGATPAGQKCCVHLHRVSGRLRCLCLNSPPASSFEPVDRYYPRGLSFAPCVLMTFNDIELEAHVFVAASPARPALAC